MTDLAKELRSFKRVWADGPPEAFSPLDGAGSEDAVMTIQRLLSIIETEIPKFIRDYPASIHGSLAVNPAEIARQVANEIASAIESLTKNEKEKG